MRGLRFGALGVALAVLNACSTSDFKQPIADFSTATTAASKSFGEYADALDKLKQDQNFEEAASGKKRVVPSGCQDAKAKKCELTLSSGGIVEPFKSQLLPNTRKLMAAIAAYAKTLEAIASPDDVAQIKTAADAIPTNLIAVAKAADALNTQTGQGTNLTAQITALATPAGDIFSIALTKYADYEKMKALRDAAENMEIIFPQATRIFSEVAFVNITIVRANLSTKLGRANDAFTDALSAKTKQLDEADKKLTEERDKPRSTDKKEAEKQQADLQNAEANFRKLKIGLIKDTKDALADYESAAEAYNVALTTKPESVFIKLGEAHTALVETLRMPNPDFQTVFALIQQIGATATSIANDAKALEKALNPKPGA
jgi:hypothetical protein